SGLGQLGGEVQVLCTTVAVDPVVPQPLYEGIELQKLAMRINDMLFLFQDDHPWFLLVDLQGFLALHGLNAVTDRRYEVMGRMYFSPRGGDLLAQHLRRCLLALTRPRKKVLVVDLDNTFWGGTLGEDGPGGITVAGEGPGYAYSRFHQALLRLKRN